MTRFSLATCFLVVLCVSVLLGAGFTEAVMSKDKESEPKPIVIKSKTLEMDNTRKMVTFQGDVQAQRDDFTMACEEMRVYYEGDPQQEKSGDVGTKINKIVATGQVKVTRSEGGVATADKATYFEQEEKLVLTGSPVVRQGNDFVEGDRITLFLKEDRSIVEGSKDKKVRAVIFPGGKKR